MAPAAAPAEETYAEWEKKLTGRERRVQEVVGMMCRGTWLSGVSDQLLAQKWQCTPQNVRQISAEASRHIRSQLREDPKAQAEARARILQNIDAIRMKAMLNGDSASLRVGLDALRAYGFYLGIEPAKRLEVQTPELFPGWTTEEKLAYSKSGKRPRRALDHMNGMESEGDDPKVH